MEKWNWTWRAVCLTGMSAGMSALMAGWTGVASGMTLTFDEPTTFEHGTVVTDQYAGVSIIAENDNRAFDYAVVFDSSLTGTRDEDLQGATGEAQVWSGGNLWDTELGNMLVLQENSAGCATGLCSQPDDEGGRPAGSLSFLFDAPVSEVGFDLVDIEGNSLESGSISLLLTDGEGSEKWVEIPFSTFLDESDLGNNTANRIEPFQAAQWAGDDADLTGIATLKINLGGSGAVDNVRFEPVPEPASALLLGLGLIALGARRQR